MQISQDDVFVVVLIKNLHSSGLLWRAAGRSQFYSVVLLKQLFHVSPGPRHGTQGTVSVAIIELETRRGDYPSPVVVLQRKKMLVNIRRKRGCCQELLVLPIYILFYIDLAYSN